MKKLRLSTGLLIGLCLSAPLIAIMYLANVLFALPFVPFDLFDWVSRVLPGPVITFGIDRMIDAFILLNINVADNAKTAERSIALLQFLGIGVVTAAIFYAVLSWRRLKGDTLTGLVLGALFGFPLVAISAAISQSPVSPLPRLAWLTLLFLGWGLALAYSYRRLTGMEAVTPPPLESAAVEKIGRRQFLIRLGATTASITVIGGGVGAVLAAAERRQLAAALDASMAHQAEGSSEMPFPNANDPVVPVPGTRPEYTPIKDHYKVFLRTEPTVIEGSTYILPITGLVDNPLMLTLDDIRNNYPSRDQYVTLRCISGRIGTTLVSTTLWTGVSLQKILADTGVQDSAYYLYITSGDGFYETLSLDLINQDERILLCYGWDGNTLPVDHGFPLRIWIPDRYGMKQPKWITGIEVVADDEDGYWVTRGWDKIARAKATSVVDTVAVNNIITDGDQRRVPVGGIAYAGARGISKVEVRVDGGPWQEAQLRAPLSETTWVIWRYEWPFQAGDHTFEVRCVDGQGNRQIEEEKSARPDGASGIHSRTATLNG